MKHIVLIRNLQVNEASVHAGFYSTGIPAMTAVYGMVHAWERNIKNLLPENEYSFDDTKGTLTVTRFAVGYSGFRVAKGPARRVTYAHGSDRDSPPSLAYDPIADFTAHLLLEVETSLSAESLLNLLKSREMRDVVTRLRWSGGAIISPSMLDVLVTDSAVKAFRQMPKDSLVLEDAHPLMAQEMAKGNDALQALMLVTSRAKPLTTQPETPYEPRFIAVAIGFLPITAQAPIDLNRDANYPHCFVEPLIGAARIRLAASAASKPSALLMWANASTSNLFLLTATPL